MSNKESSSFDSSNDEKLPLVLSGGVSRTDVTKRFVTKIHDLAEEENIQVESISVGGRAL